MAKALSLPENNTLLEDVLQELENDMDWDTNLVEQHANIGLCKRCPAKSMPSAGHVPSVSTFAQAVSIGHPGHSP